TLLLLLVSNLLLWENVASVPMCAMRNGRCFVSLKDMFDLAGSLSHEISQEVSGMLTEFYEVLLKSADILLGAWKNPLQHLEKEIATLKDVPAGVISKAKLIKEKNSGLLEGIKSLINVIHIGETENYPTWSGLASLQSDDEEARILAFYNLISCLDHDSKKVDICLNIVKCKVSQPGNC
uniref:Prolactin-2C2-like n=1 Tax=Peromyscus maniculatus bairdii TaxID=230844 RepID=A0A8C8T7U6_PERMB